MTTFQPDGMNGRSNGEDFSGQDTGSHANLGGAKDNQRGGGDRANLQQTQDLSLAILGSEPKAGAIHQRPTLSRSLSLSKGRRRDFDSELNVGVWTSSRTTYEDVNYIVFPVISRESRAGALGCVPAGGSSYSLKIPTATER